jgi:O-antigen/teichoic acid export membrane protein
MNAAKKIFSNTVYQTIGKVATMGTTILVTMLVTRKYGPAGYGTLSIILTFPALFFIVADFGMNAIVAGEITKSPKKIGYLFNNLLTLRLIFSALLSLFGIIALQLFPYPNDVKLAGSLILPTVITFGIYTSTNAVYQAKLSYNRSIVGPILRSLAVLALVLYLISLNLPVVWLVPAFIVGDILLGGASLVLVRKFVGRIRLSFDKKTFQYIALAAFPLGMAAMTNPIIGKADILLLSVLKNESAVGFYNLAYKVFEVCLVVPVFFVNAAYPYMIRHFKESKDKLASTSRKLFWALLLMGFVATAVVLAGAPLIVKIIGGSGFESSVLALRILALSFPIFFVTNVLLWHLITIGRRKPIPFIYWAAVLLNIGANLIVIPRWSFIGSAVVNGLTEVFVLVGLVIVVIRRSHRCLVTPRPL